MKLPRNNPLPIGVLLLAAIVSLTDGWAASAPTKPAAPAPAPAAAAAAATSLESFANISGRNIFNANRFGPVVRRTEEPPRVTRTVVAESFSLLGTLEYPKGLVAFFEGSSASHRKAVKVEESIAGCKVTGIEPNLVRLEANGKPMELRVGYMLHRENEGEWKTREAERPSDYGSSYTSSSSSGSSPFPSSSSGSSSSRYSPSFGSSSSRSSSSFSSSENPAEAAQRRIREQDRNGDGKISRSEADSRLRDRFRDMDRNRDDHVDAEEYTAYYASRMSGSSSGTPSPSTFGNASSPGSFGGSTPAGSSSPPPAGAPSSGGGESDLLRRLMEQRARENR